MKKHILLQDAMILIALALLVIGFIPGTMTGSYQTSSGAVITEHRSFADVFSFDYFSGAPMVFYVLMTFVCAVAFRISQSASWLNWTCVGAILGLGLYLLLLLSAKKNYDLDYSVIFFVLFLIELLLGIFYKIAKQKKMFS